jgi:hypothetical protein
MNGSLLALVLQYLVQDAIGLQGPLTDDIRDQVEKDLLSRTETDAFALFTTAVAPLQARKASQLASMDVLADARRRAIEEGFASRISKWTPSAISTKKLLQRKIRVEMRNHEALIRETLAAHCRAVVGSFVAAGEGTSASSAGAADGGGMTLGDGAQAYTDFLALKNAIEKNISTYNASVSLSAVVASTDTSMGGSKTSAAYHGQQVLGERLDGVRSAVMREYVVSSLQVGLQKGEEWVREFEVLLEQTEKRKSDMRERYVSLQAQDATLDRSIVTHKKTSAETIRALTVSLSAARVKQASEMETLESEVQVIS